MNSKSFTLIELMTVVAIVAILSGITLVGFNLFLKQGKIAKSMAFDSSIHFNLGYAIKGDWKMNDNAANSTVVDTSGYNNDGTFNDSTNPNTSYHSVDGANGAALEFDGVDDKVVVPDNDSLDIVDELTIGGWVKFKSQADLRGVFAKQNGASWLNIDYGFVQRYPGGVYFVIADGTGYNEHVSKISAPTPNDDQWYYLVGVLTSTKLKVYVDGELMGETTRTTDPKTDSDVIIGGRWNNYFDGLIDQVRIYSVAFSLSQVKYQYYAGLQKLYDKGLMSGKEYKSRIVKLNSES